MSDPAPPDESKETPPPRRRWRERPWWVRYLAYLGIFLALLVATYAFFGIRGRMRWKAYVGEIEASGSSLDIRELIPQPPKEGSFWQEPVVERMREQFGTNVIPAPEEIVPDYQGLPDTRNWRFARPRNLATSFPTLKLTDDQAARRLLSVVGRHAALDALATASRKPIGGFFWPDSHTERIKQPIAGVFMIPTRWWLIQAHSHIELSNSEPALEALPAIAAISIHTGSSGSLVDQTLSIGTLSLLLEPLWNGLDRRTRNDEELQKLASEVTRWRKAIPDFGRVLEKERALTHSSIEALWVTPERRWKSLQQEILDPLWEPETASLGPPLDDYADAAVEWANKGLWMLIPSSVIRGNLSNRDQLNRETLLNAHLPLSERMKREQDRIQDLEAASFHPPFKILCRFVYGGVLGKSRELDQWFSLIQAAIAAERCYLRTGKYPTSWSELVPDWLPRIPEDIWSGGELRYRIGPAGRPVIYSVGRNGVDDYGIAATHPDKGDLVWRYSLPPGFTLDDYVK